MRFAERKRSAGFSAIMVSLGTICVLGAIYCLLALTGAQSYHPTLTQRQLLFYGSWYVVSAIAVVAILHWRRWGVYLAGVATLLVAGANILRGTVTVQAATLAVIVVASLLAYMRPIWHHFR
jgi:hypothetical protein